MATSISIEAVINYKKYMENRELKRKREINETKKYGWTNGQSELKSRWSGIIKSKVRYLEQKNHKKTFQHI